MYPTVSPMNPPIQAMGIRSQSPRQAALVYADSTGRNQQSLRKEARTVSSPLTSPPLEQDISPASSSSSSSSDSGAEETTRRGPPFARFGRFSVHRGSNSIDEDEEDSPAFLPLTTHHKSSIQEAGHDPSATLRQEPELPGHPHAGSADTTIPLIKTSATEFSASSGSSEPASSAASNERPRPTGHPINPDRRRTAELARLSPRRRAAGREGSDGTPSMGSSFSDLDGAPFPQQMNIIYSCVCRFANYYIQPADASLTQSALEEALLSTMQRGGVASRMSTISQALKSRYL